MKREFYLKQIRSFYNKDVIKVLSGIRSSGKSSILKEIQNELINLGVKEANIISINFENNMSSNSYDARFFINEIMNKSKEIKGKIYLFLDELDNLKDYETFINSLLTSLDLDIYIVTTNSINLNNTLNRVITFRIFPLSFKEFKENNNEWNEEECFNKYLKVGAIPFLNNFKYDESNSKKYLEDLLSVIELKDIIKKHYVRDVCLLEEIIFYLLMNIGSFISANSIVKYLKNIGIKASNETVINYLNYIVDSHLFYKVSRIDVLKNKILLTNEKYYIADHGIREAMFGGNIKDINLILENIVFIEAKRRNYDVKVGRVGEKDKEIDFVLTKQNEKVYIQVSYMLGSEETINREFDVYNEIHDNFKKYVVTMDTLDFSRNGIVHKNIKDFLLMENW